MATSVAAGRPRRSFDWRQAARLWVSGVESGAIATAMGIDEDYFWHHLERSPRFRRFVASARAREIQNCHEEIVNLVRDKPN